MKLFLFLALFPGPAAAEAAGPAYDCSSPRPEMAGFHSMVLFGKPGEQLYAYHLPLFPGAVNGVSGHVLMHVYQGLWKVQLDPVTRSAYDRRFSRDASATTPFPFFSIGPRGKTFKVPELICGRNFPLSAQVVSGHVEGNPAFPAPEKLIDGLSGLVVKETVFARRFDGSASPALSYLLFGDSRQFYMMHLLSDDESSFDQIVGVEVLDKDLEARILAEAAVRVTVPVGAENALAGVPGRDTQRSENNRWMLPASPPGKSLRVEVSRSGEAGRVRIQGDIYFNANEDLAK